MDTVIILTRLGGRELALNPDLMERAEATPDTVITMVDGHKIVVAESLTEVVDRVRTWRASVAAEAYGLSRTASPLGLVPGLGLPDDDGPAGGPLTAFEEVSAQDSTAHTSGPAHMARVLRLPTRED